MINSLLPIDGTISIYRDCCIAIDRNLTEGEVLAVAKCILTNAKQTCDAILKGKLTLLDPIVGENACQIRALVVISAYLDLDLKKELQILSDKVDKLVKETTRLIGTLGSLKMRPQFNKSGSLSEQINSLGLSLDVSEKIDYLMRTHLLTVGKYFYVNQVGGERCGIDCQNIKNRLKTSIDIEILKKVVGIAQEKISCDSITFLQNQTNVVEIENRFIRLIAPGSITLHSSCAFYNLKAVMRCVNEMKVPILLKEHGKKNPMGMYCDLVPEKSDQPILVIECFFPEGCKKDNIMEAVQQHGLMNLVLANVACTPQYTVDDDISLLDLASQEEILKYRTLGKELGCQTANPSVFSIAHIHAATVKEEKVI